MAKEQGRKVGPSGPVAGLFRAIREAATAPPANLAELLDQHRKCKGMNKAVERSLYGAFVYLVLRKCRTAIEKGCRDIDELLCAWSNDLVKCITRLAKNNTPPDEVESYIKNELYHSYKHLFAANTLNLNPPASTISDRKRDGREPLPEPVRVRKATPTNWEPDQETGCSPLEDPKYSYLVEAEDHRMTAPSRFNQPPVGQEIDEEDSCHFIVDTLVTAAQTPLEKTIAGMMLAGLSGNAIAQSLKVPRKQIANIIGLLRGRVRRRLDRKESSLLATAIPSSVQPQPKNVADLPSPRPPCASVAFEKATQATAV